VWLSVALRRNNERGNWPNRKRLSKRRPIFFVQFFASMGDGVVVADELGKVILYNPTAAQWFGPSLTDGCADATDFVFNLTDEFDSVSAPDRRPLARALRGEAVDEAEGFVPLSGKTGGIWLSATPARPLKNEVGAVQGGVVVFRDITGRKHVEAELGMSLKGASDNWRNASTTYSGSVSPTVRI